VPTATLGISAATDNQGRALDAWNNPIHYAVTKSNSKAYTTSNGMADEGLEALNPNLLVCSTATGISGANCAAGKKLTALSGVPVILYSTGKNAAYGGTGLDEAENNDNDRTFINHEPRPSTATNGEFDDIVTWVSNLTLLNRMVAAW
jgi:hypothetical protein